MKHLIFYLFLIFNLFFLININSNAETVEDLVEALNDIKEEIKSLPSSDSKEAKIIDQSLEEINKVANFALEKIESKDLETAKSALAYTDKSIGNVGKVIPKEFESDMSNANLENFAPEKMETLKEITTAMNSKKKDDKNLLLDQIIELNDKGFNTTEISSNLASLGVDTVTLIELDNRKFDKIKSKIVDNQLEISAKQKDIKILEDKLDPLETQIRSLKGQKQTITDKYNTDLSLQTIEGKQAYETQLAALNQKISTFEAETKSINSSMGTINLELNKLEEIQKITATKAKLLVPDAALSVKFNYENTSISKEAARVGAISLGKSESDWAKSWKGDINTTTIVDGNVVNLSDDEIQSVKANLAMESAMQALATGQISKDLTIDASELNLATSLSANIMVETLQRQSKYLSYAVKEGMHEMTTESAMLGVKSLGKSEAEWAAAWTGGDPTHHNVNGVKVPIGAAEAQKIKAEWAMNRAAQSIVEGKTFTDGSLTIDANDIQQATATATKEAMADVQKKAANIASQVASTAEAIQNFDTSSLSQDLAAATKELISNNSKLQQTISQNAISTVAELEDQLDISVESLVSDTSSWTEAQWAASWTGDPPTHHNVNGVKVPIGAAEAQKIKAEWAKNQAKSQGN